MDTSDWALDGLRSSALRFATAHRREGPVRAGSPGGRRWWSSAAAMGWLETVGIEEEGDRAFGIRAASAIAECLGREALGLPFCAAGVMPVGVLRWCDNPVAEDRLHEVVSGQRLTSVAWQPRFGGLEATGSDLQSTSAGNAGWWLRGMSNYVQVPDADAFLVFARCADVLQIAWVPRTATGLVVEEELLADGSFCARLRFDDVLVSHGDVLAQGHAAERAMALSLDQTLIVASAELLGVMSAALDMTLAYLKTRHQFGRPIGANQALQHRAVDLYIQRQLTAAALAATLQTLGAGDRADGEVARLASALKYRAASAAMKICTGSVHLHGAMGFTEECGLGAYLKRALVLSAWLGGPRMHGLRYQSLTS